MHIDENRIDRRTRRFGELNVASGLLAALACLGSLGAQTSLVRAESIAIPLQHVSLDSDQDGSEDGDDGDAASDAEDDDAAPDAEDEDASDDDASDDEDGSSDDSSDEDDSADNDDGDDEVSYDRLGIMIGINGAEPRLYEFDTGSDELNAEIDPNVPGVKPARGSKPEMYAYGNGSYGDWVQQVRFDSLSYYDPGDPTDPVATFDGSYGAGRVMDYVYTKDYDGFDDLNVEQNPVGHVDGKPVYADLDAREKMQNGEPAGEPVLYGVYGAGDFVDEGDQTTAPGNHTQSGYIVSANANIGEDATPGCAPCLILNLDPSLRSQFTALIPWGKMGRQGYQKKFPRSGANTSTEYEGSYSYTITFDNGDGKDSVDFEGPILLDTGTPNFVFVTTKGVLNDLNSAGFSLSEYGSDNVDFSFFGSDDSINNLEFNDVDIYRQSEEDEGGGLILGLPFFHTASVMYDLKNKTTAYSPYFVSVDDFTTDAADEDVARLNRATAALGSEGWLGLAGVLAGDDSFIVEGGATVRMTNANTYTGTTYVESNGFLYLAGPGSIQHSSQVVVNGVLDVSQKGDYLDQWGVSGSQNDALIRSLNGAGTVQLGARKLVLTDADGRFEGSIIDQDDDGNQLGGGLVVAGGKLAMTGENDYSGPTEVAAGAELHVTGSLAGDVAVSGLLTVDGQVTGHVTVEEGGRLTGSGTVGGVTVEKGGTADPIDTGN